MSRLIKQELNLFFHALLFYSRLPAGKISFSDDNLAQSFRYFPLVGAIVGCIGWGVGWGAEFLFSHSVVVLLVLAAMVLATGAFHEDGFSDFWDGFGGGHSPERILEIMKDSTSGVYGVVSLIFLFLLKFLLLESIETSSYWILILMGASSRLPSIFVATFSTYARSQSIKATNLTHKANFTTLIIATLISVLPLFLYLPMGFVGALILLFFFIGWGIKSYSECRIGGYTGDVLGALQQFSELAFLLLYVAYIRF